MPTESLDDVLEHYGIKGMKWGVRRTPEQLARARGKKKDGKLTKTPINMVSKDAKQVKTSRERVVKKKNQKDTSPLSNDELKQVIQRMSLEKQYKELENKEALDRKKQGEMNVKKVENALKTYSEVMKFINSDAGKWLIQNIRQLV